MSNTAFSSLPLKADLLSNLTTLGYTEMTPIQAQSLPPILQGKDIIAQAKTGSGKTAAFGLGLLNRLVVKRFRIQTLVLCPTRELADQVAKEIRRLARGIHNIKVLTLCGGMPFGPQIGSLEHGAHIVVGTPGRVADHLRKGTLKLRDVNTLVLDEADRMLEMGFQETLDKIIERVPSKRQTLLFSATYPEQIQSMAEHILVKPVMVQVQALHDSSSIKQHFYKVKDNAERLQAVQLLLMEFRPASTLVFCNTRRETQEVANALHDAGVSALALHGDMEQRDRDQTLIRFANQSASVLVATDVAARGLDIADLDAVINYHVAHDAETHVHRVGRTGRGGSKGLALSLFSGREEYRVAQLELDLDPIVDCEALPPTLLLKNEALKPPMKTLQIDGGKKQKVRPGDILGALTRDGGLQGKQVGKINVGDNHAYVAISRSKAKTALKKLNEGLKGRSFRVRLLRD